MDSRTKQKTLTQPVGINMLFQEINRAKADNKTPSKPERDQWAIFLMKVHQELMQTAAGNDIWQVAVPEEHNKDIWSGTVSTGKAEID